MCTLNIVPQIIGYSQPVLTCRSQHLRHKAYPPQWSTDGTHYRYGPQTPQVSNRKSVPAISTPQGVPKYTPQAPDPRIGLSHSPPPNALITNSSKVISTHAKSISPSHTYTCNRSQSISYIYQDKHRVQGIQAFK